jgi:hypothetical protein
MLNLMPLPSMGDNRRQTWILCFSTYHLTDSIATVGNLA